MKILVAGATGFIASQLVTDLLAGGHEVICCVRNIDYAKNLFPAAHVIFCDYVNDVDSDKWFPRLKNVDVVINCVGILHHPSKKVVWAIHYETPRALFNACVKAGVKKIIQISALGVDKINLEYAKSKKAADDYLLTLPITAIILRPSLVYGRGSYGGTSLFRALAGLPWFTPVPGKGRQKFQPIYLQDFSKSILNLVSSSIKSSAILSAVGPGRINLSAVLITLRAWLGFSKSKLLFVPLSFIRLGSLLGNLIPYSAMNITSYKMLAQDNVASQEETDKFHNQIGFIPRDFVTGLYSQPSTVQDHWHARLYFLKPLLQMGIGFIFMWTAITSLFLYPKVASYVLLSKMGVSFFWQPIFLYFLSGVDAALGLAVLFSYKLKEVCLLQLVFVLGYTLLATYKLPYLWLDPLGCIVKNIPILISLLVLIAIESDR